MTTSPATAKLTNGTARILTAAALALALTSCGTTTPGPVKAGANASPAAAATATIDTPQEALALQSAYEQVIKRVLPSIVQITTTSGLGSGIVFDTSGHIVTNAHVVGDAQQFQVSVASGGETRPATLVGAFQAGDIAVIKVANASGLSPAPFGDSSATRVGQVVLAMGNPLGFSGSVTQGIISALNRDVTEPQSQGSPGATLADAIQTSAAINPGNSGGALVDLSGAVIGIPTLAATDPEMGSAANGIGFAIPGNTVKDIAAQLIKDGRVTNSRRAALGVQVGTAVGPDGNPAGVIVGRVTAGGSAAKAGIKAGDVIVSVNGTETPSTAVLSQVLANLQPGDQCKVEVRHPNDQTDTVTVTLGQLPGN